MMTPARVAVLLAVATAATVLAGCESSQSRSARLASQAAALPTAAAGVSVTKANTEIEAETTVLTDENGTAVVARLRHHGREDAFEVPVQLTLTDEAGTELFSTATPGLQPSLTHVPHVAAGGTTWWVNDQIPLTAPPADHELVVGEGTGRDPGVRFTATAPRLQEDPASGVAAVGRVEHDGKREQQRVLVSVIAQRGGKVVAAGRAIVARVKVGRPAAYTAFFIGDPRGADLTAIAAPSYDSE